ncbi:hypothetical protein ACFQGE_06315 [Halomicroarcula sp. GCM10025817]|uniref:hypothetical protein n=1 Tax=Haloarcula TaxID=2237 RepID=UPI0023E83BC7|nr:hypothetical protein [Halomicroarcula sp. SYNS111]
MTNEDTDSPSQQTDAQSSRRRFLRTTALGGILGLAGCLSTDSGTEEDAPTATMGAIEQVEFAGEHLVLTATEAFSGTELHVVDPTETVWAKTRTEHTTGKARIQLLDVDGYDDDNHYTPGQFRFVFEPRAEEPHTELVDLAPDVSILEVRQRDSGAPGSAGQIAVKMTNRGTAPTWISDIKYEGAPHYSANGDFSDSDFPFLSDLEKPTEAIIPPNTVREYVAQNFPLRFTDRAHDQCSQIQFTMGISVKTPIEHSPENRINVKTGGEPIVSSSLDRYVCSDVDLELIGMSDQ